MQDLKIKSNVGTDDVWLVVFPDWGQHFKFLYNTVTVFGWAQKCQMSWTV